MPTGKKRPRKKPPVLHRRPRLTIAQILAWADDFNQRTGRWPKTDSGRIPGALGETWGRVDGALTCGYRGLPGGSSLPRLLHEHRGVRNHKQLPPLTPAQILTWADAHCQRTGNWPTAVSGPVVDAPGETWAAANAALSIGNRGLPGGSSLPQLLAQQRGVRNHLQLPHLTEELILAWADAHQRRTGQWPHDHSGAIADAPGETWCGVTEALRQGHRGLPAGSSLAQLLAQRRGVRNPHVLPPLTETQILAWADAHHARTGKWPTVKSGPIPDAPGETWWTVAKALYSGRRGLPGRSSLATLLAVQRGKRNHRNLPRLTVEQILAWADAYHQRTGQWPSNEHGPIPGTAGETWSSVDVALRKASRGLRGASSLARLLAERRGKRNHKNLPKLNVAQIIKFLHQQCGFDVLAFESGLYDCRKAWELLRGGTMSPRQAVSHGVFAIWTQSEQVQPPSGGHWHGAVNAKRPGLVVGGTNHVTAVDAADNDRLTLQLGPVVLLGIKSVHIHVQNRHGIESH